MAYVTLGSSGGLVMGNSSRGSTRLVAQRLEDRLTPTVDFLDVPYAATGNPRHVLDLHLPDNYLSLPELPLVVWIHGGGWQSGDEDDWSPAQPLVAEGYAVASVSYRLSSDAGPPVFPDPIHDVKAAVRWLRGNATAYNWDPGRIGAMGSSAGGHLAALLGVSAGVVSLEGTVGDHLGQSSAVQAVVDLFGPTDLWQMWQVAGYSSHGDAGSPESKLIGATLSQNQALADAASPVTYVTDDDPPFLIYHGTSTGNGDGTVPWQQSQILYDELASAGVDATLHLVPNANHGYGSITANRPTTAAEIVAFFDAQLASPPNLPLDGTVTLAAISNNAALTAAGVTGYDYTLTRTDNSVTTGVLLVPPGATTNPAVLVSHGAAGSVAGARNFGITNGLHFAKSGYVVIAPIYEHAVGTTTPFNTAETLRRASDGVAILLNIDAVDAGTPVDLPSVDTTQIAAYGHSKGAYLTVLLAQNSEVKPFVRVAAITAGGVRSGGQSPPVGDADLIDVPFVIQHAEDDPTVPFSEGQALFDNLRAEVQAASLMQGYADLLLPGGAVQPDPEHNLHSARATDVFPLAIDFFNQILSRDPQPRRTGDDSITIADTWGAAHTVTVLANDPLPSGWVVSAVTQPGRGQATLGPGAAITYTYRELVSPPGEPAFSGDDYFTYTVSDGKGQTDTARVRVQIRPASAPPRVEQVTVGDGTAQRSRVTSLAVTFTSPVALQANSALLVHATGGEVAVSVTGSGSNYIITPTDAGFVDAGSLIEGKYTLTLVANGILDGNGDGTPGDNFTTTFHRLFGDSNGDGFTDNLDFLAFRLTNGSDSTTPQWNPALDNNGDGFIDNVDFVAFRERLGIVL